MLATDKLSLVREMHDNAWEITKLVKSSINSEEVEKFYNELKIAQSEETANSILLNYLGVEKTSLFKNSYKNLMVAGMSLKEMNITREEFDDLVSKVNIPKDDENVGGACKSWTAYQQCTNACNGASAWASHAWTIVWGTAGGVGTGSAIGSLFGGVGAPLGGLAGGLYGFYEAFDEVGEKYGDCIQKCYDYHCEGKDTGPKGKGGGIPGGGRKEDNTPQ